MIRWLQAGELTPNDIGQIITFRALEDTYVTGPLHDFMPSEGSVKVRVKGIEAQGIRDIYYIPEKYFRLGLQEDIQLDDKK